jgi:hypothetical protein
MTDEERAEKDSVGLAALQDQDAARRDVIVYDGGPLGPTKRIDDDGEVTDAVNLLTVFVVVRSDSHEAAARLFASHPHMTVFPCDGVEVMPVLGS